MMCFEYVLKLSNRFFLQRRAAEDIRACNFIILTGVCCLASVSPVGNRKVAILNTVLN